MILSDNSRPFTTRCMQFCVALLAVLFVPLGMTPLDSANAQDIEAVERRLTKSVKRHELTLEQAAVMMNALKEFMEEEHEHHEHGHHEHGHHEHDSHGGEHEHHEEHGHHRHEEAEFEDRRMEELRHAEMELMRAVKNGRISEQDAKRRLIEHKKHLWGDSDESKKNEMSEFKRKYREAEGRLAKMVEAGEISEEAAEERLASMKEYWKEAKQKTNSQTEFARQMERVKRRVQAGVESGRMTEEQAKETYEKYEKQFMQEAHDKEEEEEEEEAEHEDDDDKRTIRFENAKQTLQRYVEAGEITEAQANERLEKLHERLWPHDHDEDSDSDDRAGNAQVRLRNIGLRIRRAIQEGDMTREEGRAKYEELRRELEGHNQNDGDHEDDGDHEEDDDDDR